MPAKNDLLTIGEVAARSGLAPSAIRFYEAEGLITAARTAGGQRVFPRYVLRRLAFISSAQRVGLTLREIADALAGLPTDRAPTKAAWARLTSASRSSNGFVRRSRRVSDADACPSPPAGSSTRAMRPPGAAREPGTS